MIDMNNKIAIITEYYKSSNYGGNLQAYALTCFLNENGFRAEQLPYIRPKRTFRDDWKETNAFINKLTLFTKRVIQKTLKRGEFNQVKKRRQKVIEFGYRKTPHCKKVYTDADLKAVYKNFNSKTGKDLTEYSSFITGSDQVWRTIKKEAYFLTFVPEVKRKISYAASISKNSLTDEEKVFFCNALKSFDAISVREKSDVNLLADLYEGPIEWVLDPTLLLDIQQWNDICSPRLCKEKYVFCYFLGNENKPRKLAKDYAKKYNLKLLTIPYLSSEYPLSDFILKKDEKKLFDVGVEDFLSLIKYAEVIFTDSFHAVVFSGIFKRQYFVFERTIGVSMSSRIRSIVDIYETPERFCDTESKETLNYLESLQSIDYSKNLSKLENMKKKSKDWLLKNLKDEQKL